MVSGVAGESGATFFALTPDRVLDAVEVGGLRCTGRCLPLRAFENRVYEVELEDERRLVVKRYIFGPLEGLMAGRFIPEGLAPRYRDVAVRIAEAAAKILATARVQRIHGDLHWGNILWTPDPLLVDFDDCLVGPPVQDIWLLARGHSEEARKLREDLLEGYELFREFDRSSLALCEPLRAMRIVYMSGWIARRWSDPSFPPAFPLFRNHNYWNQEYEELVQIAETLG